MTTATVTTNPCAICGRTDTGSIKDVPLCLAEHYTADFADAVLSGMKVAQTQGVVQAAGIKATVLQVLGTDSTGHHYEWDPPNARYAISDFVTDPVATIKVNGDEAQTIYEVLIHGEKFQISAGKDLANNSALTKWCRSRGLSWRVTAQGMP